MLIVHGRPCNEKTNTFLGFEVFTAVIMNSSVFLDITPCSPLTVNRRFGAIYRHHLQGRKLSQARNQREAACYFHTLVSYFAYSSSPKAETTCFSETSIDVQ
jgi:hypothetical protein